MKFVFIFDTDSEAAGYFKKVLEMLDSNDVKFCENPLKKSIKFKDGDEMYFMDFMEFANFKVGRYSDSYHITRMSYSKDWQNDSYFYLENFVSVKIHNSKEEKDKKDTIKPGDEVLVKMRVVNVCENGITVQSNVIESFMVPVEDVVKQ